MTLRICRTNGSHAGEPDTQRSATNANEISSLQLSDSNDGFISIVSAMTIGQASVRWESCWCMGKDQDMKEAKESLGGNEAVEANSLRRSE